MGYVDLTLYTPGAGAPSSIRPNYYQEDAPHFSVRGPSTLDLSHRPCRYS